MSLSYGLTNAVWTTVTVCFVTLQRRHLMVMAVSFFEVVHFYLLCSMSMAPFRSGCHHFVTKAACRIWRWQNRRTPITNHKSQITSFAWDDRIAWCCFVAGMVHFCTQVRIWCGHFTCPRLCVVHFNSPFFVHVLPSKMEARSYERGIEPRLAMPIWNKK